MVNPVLVQAARFTAKQAGKRAVKSEAKEALEEEAAERGFTTGDLPVNRPVVPPGKVDDLGDIPF